jgi:hypothetical protein
MCNSASSIDYRRSEMTDEEDLVEEDHLSCYRLVHQIH